MSKDKGDFTDAFIYFHASRTCQGARVYQVLKPLYGMPQSGRCLHVTWSSWLESQGLQKAGYESAMWSRKDMDGDTILVATHVDDSIVTGSNDDKTDTSRARDAGQIRRHLRA